MTARTLRSSRAPMLLAAWVIAATGSAIVHAQETTPATETEAQMLSAGRFSEYHLTKAKRIFEAGNFKEAAHQAAIATLMPELARAFDDWSAGDMQRLFADLDRLKLWLDAERDR